MPAGLVFKCVYFNYNDISIEAALKLQREFYKQ